MYQFTDILVDRFTDILVDRFTDILVNRFTDITCRPSRKSCFWIGRYVAAIGSDGESKSEKKKIPLHRKAPQIHKRYLLMVATGRNEAGRTQGGPNPRAVSGPTHRGENFIAYTSAVPRAGAVFFFFFFFFYLTPQN